MLESYQRSIVQQQRYHEGHYTGFCFTKNKIIWYEVNSYDEEAERREEKFVAKPESIFNLKLTRINGKFSTHSNSNFSFISNIICRFMVANHKYKNKKLIVRWKII